MKKRSRTYFLLAMVLFIWGAIGYRLVYTIGRPSIRSGTEEVAEKFIPKKIGKKKHFSIVADYRDPFLGTLAPSLQKPVKKNVKTRSPEKKTVKRNIVYTGFVTGKDKSDRIFFITVDGKERPMAEKDTFMGVKLLQGTKDHIKVRYNGTTDKVFLQQ